VLYTVLGVPSVFYGDEVGMQGHHDPFCRLPYPWGKEDIDLLAHFTCLGELRAAHSAFADGDFRILAHTDTALLYERSNGQERILIAVNGGSQPTVLPMDTCEKMTELFRLDPGYTLPTPQPEDGIAVPAGGCVILLSRRKS
jgi:alpha-glucosidase